jgi:hypothetical protein
VDYAVVEHYARLEDNFGYIDKDLAKILNSDFGYGPSLPDFPPMSDAGNTIDSLEWVQFGQGETQTAWPPGEPEPATPPLEIDSSQPKRKLSNPISTNDYSPFDIDSLPTLDHLEPSKPKTQFSTSRLSMKAINTLQDWLIKHHLYPYPTIQEKATLATSTGLKIKQVSDWFNRTRTRKMPRNYSTQPSGKADHTFGDDDFAQYLSEFNDSTLKPFNNSSPVDIPNSAQPEIGQTPMQRFLSTPPEDDPAPLAAIAKAATAASKFGSAKNARTTKMKPSFPPVSWKPGQNSKLTYSDAGFDRVSQSDASSFAAGASRASSGNSGTSTASHASWAGRKGRRIVLPSNNNRVQKRRKGRPAGQSGPPGGPKYQCTWCFLEFTQAYDWRRHEESQHAPQTQWICLYNASLYSAQCEFCDEMSPSESHYQSSHNALECLRKLILDRAFDRKDHLFQHLKEVHKQTLPPRSIQQWSRAIQGSVPSNG